ncbi:MAG: hypothetical protein ACYDBB_14080 [Armatimonadota bacterium]
MSWTRYIIIGLVLTWTVSVLAAAETRLASISIGMKPTEVLARLGTPTATLVAQPPVIIKQVATGLEAGGMPSMGGMPGMEGGMKPEDLPNTLIFIYNNQEIEIGTSTFGSSGSSMSSMPGMPGDTGGQSGNAKLPLWAYAVRVVKLALDQQELIYKINDTYSLGITISGQGAEAKVTDIIAASYQSFTEYFDIKKQTWSRKAGNAINFTYSAAQEPKLRKAYLPAGTSRRVVLGTKFDKVLREHRWPQFFFTFTAEKLPDVVMTKNPLLPEVTVRGPSAGGAAGIGGGAMMPSGPMGAGGMGQAHGEKPVTFTDGDKLTLSSGFSKNCLLLYLNDQVALTLVDFTVVRIQIGQGVVRPPDPPKIKTASPTG